MDDLAQKISELLNSPDGMEKLQAAAASLGMLTGNKDQQVKQSEQASTSELSTNELDSIKKLMPLVSSLKQDSNETMLLKSLRPYLKQERCSRLDETLKIMQLIKAIPMFKDKGGL